MPDSPATHPYAIRVGTGATTFWQSNLGMPFTIP